MKRGIKKKENHQKTSLRAAKIILAVGVLGIACCGSNNLAQAAGDPSYDCTECHTGFLPGGAIVHTIHDQATTWAQFTCEDCHSPGVPFPDDIALYSQCNLCHDDTIHPPEPVNCADCHSGFLPGGPIVHSVHDIATTWAAYSCMDCHTFWPEFAYLYTKCSDCHDDSIHQ